MGRLSSGGRDLRRIRVGSIVGLSAATAALIATQPWHADRPERFAAMSLVLVAVLAVQVVAVLRLTGCRARVARPTLVAGCVSSLCVTGAWILPRLSGFPAQSAGAMFAIEGAAIFAAGLAGFCTRDVGQAALAALWSGALGSFLVFAGTLLTFALVPASVPETQGRNMLPTATAAQRLAENRTEAPDGYLGLLVLTSLFCLVVCVLVPTTPRARLARPTGSR